jgi:toxoflavin biosynthesis protein ToxD
MNIDPLLPAFIAIPAVPFLIGTPERELSALAKAYGGTRESYREESPQHTLTLPAFAIAQIPVTNALYALFVAATGARPPSTWRAPQPPAALLAHPVVDLSWTDARAFCEWLSAAVSRSYRLPSEAEWEHAARGVDGRTFPWGNEWQPALANTRERGLGGTLPTDNQAGASPYGCIDMAGNVWEWTTSLDAPYPYRPDDGREDAQAAGRRILRGGCYANPHGFARCACRFRLAPPVRNEFLGFRLVRE